MADSDGFEFDTSAVDRAEKELLDALNSLPPGDVAAQRIKAFTVLVEMPALFFVTKMELAGTGPTYHIATSRFEPSQRYFDLIAAVRAGELDRYVEETCS